MMEYLRDEIALWLEPRAVLGEIERELIDVAPGLSEDDRAALWLFAWSYRPSERRPVANLPQRDALADARSA